MSEKQRLVADMANTELYVECQANIGKQEQSLQKTS